MEFLSDIGAVLTGAAGGLTGGIFGIVGNFLKRRQEMAALREERAHELKLHELNASERAAETEREIRLAQESGSWRGLSASIKSDTGTVAGVELPAWVRAVRALNRPCLTLLLLGFVAALWFHLMAAIQGEASALAGVLGGEGVRELVRYITYSIVFAFSTATLWWFGDRAMTPPGFKNI